MCTGRVDLSFIFRAFLSGKDGVIIGGCWPGECHYITEGNFLALSTTLLCRKILELIGVSPERVRLEWLSASEGNRYAEVMNDFSKEVKGLGPLGVGKGVDQNALRRKLEAVRNLIPYIKLVERERLRIPVKSVEAYNEYFTGSEFNRLFKELIADKLEISLMMALLREKPCSAAELSRTLGISPSEVSRHLNDSARQGLGRFDESQNLIAAAYYDERAGSGEEKENKTLRTAALDNEKIDKILNEHQGKPGSLIHVLMEIQSENHWLPKEILNKVSQKLKVPLSRVMQIASFYKTFSLTPKGRHEVHVCTGTSCHVRGASHLLATLQDLIGIRPGETDASATFSLGGGNCLGCCTLGPEIIVDGKHHGRLTPANVEEVLKSHA
jgi:NADH-quinone oxidoreductase subunit E